MSQLIEALLLLSQQENTSAKHEVCYMVRIINDVVEQLTSLAVKGGVDVCCTTVDTSCRGDVAALSILTRNLVANAIEHSFKGGRVWVESSCENGACILTVRDEGLGIAEEDLPHICERFYRADKARSGKSGHVGLGLAIVNAIVDRHNGFLKVESKVNSGTSFTVTIPQ